jgi:hypothetical protein
MYRETVVKALTAKIRQMAASKSYDQYRARLWGAMVRLYNGGRDGNFIGAFARTIDEQLTVAWNEGADDVGVSPEEMTPEDMLILEAIINNENDFIEGLVGEITAGRDNPEYTREQFDKQWGARVDLWANRYNETVNRARMHFGANERLEWVEGPTEKKCKTCPKLNGIIAFGREWDQARLHPQMPPNDMIECEGWNCLCQLVPTTKRRTARALDRLLEIGLTGKL